MPAVALSHYRGALLQRTQLVQFSLSSRLESHIIQSQEQACSDQEYSIEE